MSRKRNQMHGAKPGKAGALTLLLLGVDQMLC